MHNNTGKTLAPLPGLNAGQAGWRFALTPAACNEDVMVTLGGDSPASAAIQLQLRADGGLKYTHGRCPRFEPPGPKHRASFGAVNGSCLISSVTVFCHVGREYVFFVYPGTAPGCYSVLVQQGEGRPVALAQDYYYNEKAGQSPAFTCLCVAGPTGAVKASGLTPCAPPEAPPPAAPQTYRVGPGRPLSCLQAAVNGAGPGDMILVDAAYRHTGILTLPFSGAPGLPIHIKGLAENGRYPVIDGDFDIYAVEASGHHTIFEGFEILNAAKAGICHHCDGLVVRGCVIHNCLMGILSDQDIGMGNCEVDGCEVYGCGHEAYSHQLYMATDDARFPGSTVKIHDCHIHDALGGNNIKSRALRNEIYRNHIVNAFYHNLELVGPDLEFNPADSPPLPHNSDVWDNYFENARWYQFRCGGDGTGDTNGTFRFVGNTVVSAFVPAEEELRVFRVMFGIRRIEAYNNSFITRAGTQAPATLWREARVSWVNGPEHGNQLVNALRDAYWQNTAQTCAADGE